MIGWLVVLSLTALETVCQSISGSLPKRGRKRRERIDESKNIQTTPTCTYCKCSRPLSYCNPNCRTPWHWKVTHHHRTTRPFPPPPPLKANMKSQVITPPTHTHTHSKYEVTSYYPIQKWQKIMTLYPYTINLNMLLVPYGIQKYVWQYGRECKP